MSTVPAYRRRGSYGVDAPAQIWILGGFVAVFLIAALVSATAS
ncbi:hypothetical protein ACFVUS_12805 [Nocardia sp. NPDC058058]